MNDNFNTIAGWTLFAGIVALGLSIGSGMYFQADKVHRPHTMGFPIEGVVEEGAAEAGPSLATLLATGDAAKGQAIFAKCTACHTIEQGGANGIGPNLWATVGEPIGKGKGGFAFSSDLAGHGGEWTFENLDAWLKSPKAFAPGTKMTFAGLGNPEDRANVIAFLNAHSDAPKPLPAAPAATADAAKPGEGPGNGPQKAEKEPVPATNGPAGQAAEAEAKKPGA